MDSGPYLSHFERACAFREETTDSFKATTLVDVSDYGLESVALAFERVCALREESTNF